MDKKIILLIILIAIAIIGMISHINKNNMDNSTAPKEVQTESKQNPIDTFAPGYTNANKKLDNLKKLREQSLEENQKDIDDALNPYK